MNRKPDFTVKNDETIAIPDILVKPSQVCRQRLKDIILVICYGYLVVKSSGTANCQPLPCNITDG